MNRCDGVIVLLMLCVNVLMMLEGSCKVDGHVSVDECWYVLSTYLDLFD